METMNNWFTSSIMYARHLLAVCMQGRGRREREREENGGGRSREGGELVKLYCKELRVDEWLNSIGIVGIVASSR